MIRSDPARVLFLDDEEARYQALITRVATPDTVVRWVRTVSEAIEALQAEAWDQVWLDHDLGTEPAVGRDVARWLCEHPEIPCDLIVVHSVNVVSAPKIVRELQEAGRPVLRFPFTEVLARAHA